MHTKELGNRGEGTAVTILKKLGFTIVEQNYYTRQGEIDIVAIKSHNFHFIEVKTTYGSYNPAENFHKTKLKRLTKAIKVYCYKHAISEDTIKIDLALVDMRNRRFSLIQDANLYFH